eukprot:c37_g1_i1 orf=73-309(+)
MFLSSNFDCFPTRVVQVSKVKVLLCLLSVTVSFIFVLPREEEKQVTRLSKQACHLAFQLANAIWHEVSLFFGLPLRIS